MKIAMHTDHLNERGVSASVFEYSKNLINLGHEITWFYDKCARINNDESIREIASKLDLHPYQNFSIASREISKKYDLVYFQKRGERDAFVVQGIPNAVHVIFNVLDKHGDTFAYVSEWLARHATRAKHQKLRAVRMRVPNVLSPLQFVPYCVDLPIHNENLRRELGIPDEAFVVLTIGGSESFDIPWVKKTVRNLLEDSKNWFIGVNTKAFVEHPRAIFVPAVTNKKEKVSYLNTANCFLHARLLGEAFGMALLEAMQSRLPILSWRGGLDRHHIDLLHKNSLYRNEADLVRKIRFLQEHGIDPAVKVNFIKSSEFTSTKVMPKFCRIFGIN